MFEKEIDINGYHIFSSKGYRYMIRPNGKKENVGKYYYLNILFNYASCSPEYVNPFMDFIRDIYNKTQRYYDENVIDYIKKKSPIVDKCSMAPFFIIIYLSMLDLEVNSSFPVGSGKEIILKRCSAVLIDKMLADDAAKMFTRKKKSFSQIQDDFSEDNFESPYYEDHYERTDSSPENDVMDALENGNGEILGY